LTSPSTISTIESISSVALGYDRARIIFNLSRSSKKLEVKNKALSKKSVRVKGRARIAHLKLKGEVKLQC